MSKNSEMVNILENFAEGKKQLLAKQIKVYGIYDFWVDFCKYVKKYCPKDAKTAQMKSTMYYFILGI